MKHFLNGTCVVMFFIACMLNASTINAQLTKQWQTLFPGSIASGNEIFGNKEILQFDALGNSYFLSNKYLPTPFEADAQTAALNSSGSVLWSKIESANVGALTPIEMITASNGDVLVSGASGYDRKNYIYKYNASGTPLWMLSNSTENSSISRMVKDISGNLIVAASPSTLDAFGIPFIQLSKFTPAGVQSWTTNYYPQDGIGMDGFSNPVTVDDQGNTYLIVRSSPYLQSSQSFWFSKYSSAGGLLWQKKIDSSQVSSAGHVTDILFNSADNSIYLAYYLVTDPNAETLDLKLVKYSTAGTKTWEKKKSISLSSYAGNERLKTDAQGNIFWWTQGYEYAMALNSTTPFAGTLYKYNSAGSEIASINASAFDTDADGNMYTTYGSVNPNNLDGTIHIQKYSASGILLFDQADTTRYKFPYGSIMADVYADNNSNVFTVIGTYPDVTVMKYHIAPCTATKLPAKVTAISGPVNNICAPFSYTYTCAATARATTYNWTVPAGAVIDAGQGTTQISMHFQSAFTNGTVSVIAANCFGVAKAAKLTIASAPPQPGAIQGPASVCANQANVQFSIAAIAGISNYQWVVPRNATIVSGQGTTTITVNFGNKSGQVKVSSVSNCGTSAASVKAVSFSCRAEASTLIAAEVFPNPSKGAFTVRLNNTGTSKSPGGIKLIQVKDVAGKTVLQLNPANAAVVTFGSELAAGIYFAEVYTDNEKQVIKLIKN